MKVSIPDPILDSKEIACEKRLLSDYEKFCKPGLLGRGIDGAGKVIDKFTPQFLKDGARHASHTLSEQELIKKAIEYSGEGFGELTRLTANATITKARIVKGIAKECPALNSFDEISFLRSYEIERVVHHARLRRILVAAAEGAATGAPGAIGIPFNLALSFFLFFRATQNIAMSYGYDVQDDPGELAIASEVTLRSLEPRLVPTTGSIGASLTKLMMVSQLTSLQSAVTKRITYEAMIKNGGMQMLFVQLRAFGHASARKALDKAGTKSIEAGLLKGLMEKIASNLSKRAVGRIVPVLGAFFGAGIDSYLMSRVLTGSNLIYHKRFVAEKAFRIQVIADARATTPPKRKMSTRKAAKSPRRSTKKVPLTKLKKPVRAKNGAGKTNRRDKTI